MRASFVTYVTDNKFPFRLLADKITAKHRKRHIMGVRVPIWDINMSRINRDIYVRHSAVGYGSGEAIADHLLENLKSFGFPLPYIRKHLCGMAMDGQYTCLHVDTHMNDKLKKSINLSWDPMHRIELATKDSNLIDDAKFIKNTLSVIHNTFSTFRVGNNFEILYSEKELCETFFSPKFFKDMKFVTYSTEVFRSFINDFKALVSSADKLDKGGDDIKKNISDTNFLMNMLFLADVNCFLSKFSKMVQISSNVPWEYSGSVDYMMGQLDLILDQIVFIRNKVETTGNFEGILTELSIDHFSFFKTATDILAKTEYQGIKLNQSRDQRQLRNDNTPTVATEQFKQLINFGARYLGALRDNLTSRFDGDTMKLCRKFGRLLDPTPYFFPTNRFITDEPFLNLTSFVEFVSGIPFIARRDDDFIQTLCFQVQEMRKVMLEVIKSLRTTGSYEQMNTVKFLKQVYSKLDSDSMAEVKYFLSCIITFPVSEAIVESWGSVIDKVIADKVAFKESTGDDADITEKLVFIKVAGPSAGAASNRKLLKRALTLMYKGSDYAKHFLRPHGKGYTSKVITKITSREEQNTLFQ